MEIYGLIGKKLEHSYSPIYFEEKFSREKIDGEYRLFEMDNPKNLRQMIEEMPDLKGLNVTIPFKLDVGAYLDKLDAIARITGSVNVIKIIRSNEGVFLMGFNTDVYGFEKTLKPLIKNRPNIRGLILGTGGAAHTVAYVFRKLGIYFNFISRKPTKVESIKYSWINAEILQNYRLIVNTTPVGMFPRVEDYMALPYDDLTPLHILYDLIYNPEETVFLQKGRAHGAITKNGLEMLQLQAERSYKIWKGKRFL